MKHLALLTILSLCTALPGSAQVKLTQGPEQITVEIDGKPFTVFYIGGKDFNRPYLHPLRAASGKIVNRSFPAGLLPGETTDHPHHAGLFYGHGDVNGYMDHPSNPRHPTYWHLRRYGLHSINPFGVSDFLNDKTQNGSLTIEPGQHVRFRYRVIVHAGVSRARLAELYKQYAQTKGSASNQ